MKVSLLGLVTLIFIVGCSSPPPTIEVAPTPNIEATVEARLAQERSIDATVAAKIEPLLTSRPTLINTHPTQALTTVTPKVQPTSTPLPRPTSTRIPRPTRVYKVPTPTPDRWGHVTCDEISDEIMALSATEPKEGRISKFIDTEVIDHSADKLSCKGLIETLSGDKYAITFYKANPSYRGAIGYESLAFTDFECEYVLPSVLDMDDDRSRHINADPNYDRILKIYDIEELMRDKSKLTCGGFAKRSRDDSWIEFYIEEDKDGDTFLGYRYVDYLTRPIPTPRPRPTHTPAPTPTLVPQNLLLDLSDFIFSGAIWVKDTSTSDCRRDNCFRPTVIEPGAFSRLRLTLSHPSDKSQTQKNIGTQISFWVKTSSVACCDKLKFSIGDVILGEWSGIKDWQYVNLELPTARPATLEWGFTRSNNVVPGVANKVWIKDVWLR